MLRPIKGATLLDHLLFHRGITKEAAADFCEPDFAKHTHDPFLMKDMEKAVSRVLGAVRANEKSVIYSDYDADGIPAAVALHDFFKKIGFGNFENYIPNRHDEGFGLNSEAVRTFSEKGVRLLITLDCGMGDAPAAQLAKDNGVDLIIIDHHLPGGVLPAAFAILNPKQEGCGYPEKMLCGAGVAFKFIQALAERLRSNVKGQLSNVPLGWEKWLLDMVGIATLSDVVPLTGENRVFARYGLTVLRKSPRLGLRALFSRLRVDQRYLTEDDIGFTISPRINAASRMGEAMDAFLLLTTTDRDEAETLAANLEKINDERKGTAAALSKEVKHKVRERYGEKAERVIVVGNPSWRPALLGPAASACVTEHKRPVFLWGRDGEGLIKGSCRSERANLVELMSKVRPGVFLQFGGHAFSGGFTVANEKIHILEEELNRVYEMTMKEEPAAEQLADWELFLDDVNWGAWKTLEALAPFGEGNPKPLFILHDIVPKSVRHFGKDNNHLELSFEKTDGRKLSAIAFFKTADDWGREVAPGKVLDLVATLEKSTFRNFPELRLRIVDIL